MKLQVYKSIKVENLNTFLDLHMHTIKENSYVGSATGNTKLSRLAQLGILKIATVSHFYK